MCLMKLHVSLDAPAYERFRQNMLTTLWHDVDKRAATLKEHFKDSGFGGKKTMQKLHGIYVSTLFEYDEGFLTDDRELAAAVWRNLYLQNPADPLHLSRVVRYVRATMAFLDSKDVNDLLVNGVQKWSPAEELVRNRQ
ncbi:Protein C35D10.5 [Aphelenchoides avenae]|nr:Protein C35D10.5 [Aphelenchus avenae]